MLTNRTTLATPVRVAAVTVIVAAGLAACSGSSGSSGGSGTSPSATPTVLQTAGGPALTHGGAAGPNGDITAPATNTPAAGSPGGSVVFPHITAQQDKVLAVRLTKIHGVRAATYYPQFKQLQVFFTPKATTADRAEVDRDVAAG